jgi:predicted RNA-binding protein YlqC (UPF0109 family)
MKDTLEYIIKAIVTDEDSVKIEERDEDGILNLIITVAKDDMGKIIGKEGKVIRSIRNIMKIKAMKHDVRINITLAEIPQE